MSGFEWDWVCIVVSVFCFVMENFSLEDDDYGDLFITQSSNDNGGSRLIQESSENDKFLGLNAGDFQSPCTSLVKSHLHSSQYSDISDCEEEIAGVSTQNNENRYVECNVLY